MAKWDKTTYTGSFSAVENTGSLHYMPFEHELYTHDIVRMIPTIVSGSMEERVFYDAEYDTHLTEKVEVTREVPLWEEDDLVKNHEEYEKNTPKWKKLFK
jgi:hypothetical protein